MDRQPFAGHADRGAPGEVLPEVELDLGGANDLGHLLQQFVAVVVDRGIELGARHDAVDPAPVERGLRADRPVQHDHLAGAPVSDQQRHPLGRASGRQRATGWTDVAEHDVIGRDGKVAGNVQLVASTNDHAVESGNDRFRAAADGLDHLDEATHPVPVVVGPAQELLLLGEIGAGAERSIAGSRDHHDADPVIGRSLPHGVSNALDRRAIERVEHVRAVEPDGRARRPRPCSGRSFGSHAASGSPTGSAAGPTSSSATSVRSPGAISRRFRAGEAHRLAGHRQRRAQRGRRRPSGWSAPGRCPA